MNARIITRFWLVGCLAWLPACQTATSLWSEPSPSDPNDGYAGILPQAGIDTAMDWGPKQSHLLADFAALKEDHAKLQRSFDDNVIEKQNLVAQLEAANAASAKEKTQRAQAEAEADLLRGKRRELEARILTLSLEKAKLEQATLLAKIEAMQAALDAQNNAQNPAAPAPERR